MHPVLFMIGPLPVHTYGFLIAMGFLAALYVLKRLSIQAKLNVDAVLDFAFWALLVGFVGARLLYIATRFSYFLDYPLEVFKVW